MVCLSLTPGSGRFVGWLLKIIPVSCSRKPAFNLLDRRPQVQLVTQQLRAGLPRHQANHVRMLPPWSGRTIVFWRSRHRPDQRRPRGSEFPGSGKRRRRGAFEPSGRLPLALARPEGLEHRRKRLQEPDAYLEVSVPGQVVPRVLGPGRKSWGRFQQRPGGELQPIVVAAPPHRSTNSSGGFRAALEVGDRRHGRHPGLLHQGRAGQRPLNGHPAEVETRWGLFDHFRRLFATKDTFFAFYPLA